jgi:hypothetical protein
VHGASADQLPRLAIVPREVVGLASLQPTAGRFEAAADEVRFASRFPLVPGTTYSLLLDGVEVSSATLPRRAASGQTCVVAVYPSAPRVPLNLLKIYVRFSAPMSEGHAREAVQVRAAGSGQVIEGVFLPMEPELWDRARTRLTLLLDPGRIKRGLAPNLEIGYPLQEGVPILLSVDQRFRDAEGLGLLEGMQRGYEVGAAVRGHVKPADWRIDVPRSESTQPLRVVFDRPLDRALLEHSLVLVDAADNAVSGESAITDGELSWSFRPHIAWRSERYRLLVDSRLEDLAGNSLVRVFDRDLGRPEDAPLRLDRAALEFHPAA